MNPERTVMRHLRRASGILILLLPILLMSQAACVNINPPVNCADIHITVAPGQCATFYNPCPNINESFISPAELILEAGTPYSIKGGGPTGAPLEFCAAMDAPAVNDQQVRFSDSIVPPPALGVVSSSPCQAQHLPHLQALRPVHHPVRRLAHRRARRLTSPSP